MKENETPIFMLELARIFRDELEKTHNQTKDILNNGIKSDLLEVKDKIKVLPELTEGLKYLTITMNSLTENINSLVSQDREQDKKIIRLETMMRGYNWITGGLILTTLGILLTKLLG